MMNFFPKIGIIGFGFVGNAVAHSYENTNLLMIDTDPMKGCTATYSDILKAEGIFVCVPSPANEDGSCNTAILESVLNNLKSYQGVIISKVTATPDAYERLQKLFPNLVHVPEFLTANNAVADDAKEDWAIIGGSVMAYQREAERIIRYAKPKIEAVFCSIGEASMVKYIANSYLATRVVFMNEMATVAEKNNYDWNKIRLMLAKDHRIGDSHTQVPGPDGHYGFGGMCFPKDTSAIIKYAESLSINLNILKEAVRKNTLLRLTEPK